MASVHQRLAQRSRVLLDAVQGQTASYQPPEEGAIVPNVVVRLGSAKDMIYNSDDGEFRVRERVINFSVGIAEGQVPSPVIGGKFILPLADGGTEAWPIESWDNSEDNDAENYRRAKCVRPIKQTGQIGKPRGSK